jgi:hypothetical protein
VIFENEKATYAPIESGLSLFLYYINDIPVCLNSSRRHHCIHGCKIHYPCTTFATRSRIPSKVNKRIDTSISISKNDLNANHVLKY